MYDDSYSTVCTAIPSLHHNYKKRVYVYLISMLTYCDKMLSLTITTAYRYKYNIHRRTLMTFQCNVTTPKNHNLKGLTHRR